MSDRSATYSLAKTYACGAVSPGVALLMATRVAQVPEVRETVAQYEQLGGALLRDEAPAELGAGALDCVLAALDEDDVAAPRHPASGPLPQTLIDAVGLDFGAIPWRFRLPGVSEYTLDGFGDEHVSLLRARPGSVIPQHTHEGEELTLVLTGLLADGGNVYGAGDLASNDEHVDHKPSIIGDEICHCLIVRTGSLRFTGRFSRALNYLGE